MVSAFAHRGLWSPGGAPENSIAAFRAAAAAGTGIELDVQLSKDGVPIVFHDPMLDRMTEATGAVWNLTEEDLITLTLAGSDERIPTLSAVLRALPPGVAVLAELKPSPGDPLDYLRAIDLALYGTRADVAVMSFTAPLNAAAQAIMPDRTRGLLLAPGATDHAKAMADAETLGAAYLAVHHSRLAAFTADAPAARPLYAWTVDTEAALTAVKGAAEGIIFEHLDPALVTG